MNLKTYLFSAIAAVGLSALPVAHAQTTVAGWDTHTQAGGTGVWGPSPFTATTAPTGVTVGGLTRGSGVLTPAGSAAAARGWGGTDWTSTSSATAITAGDYFTFTIAPAAGYTLSLSDVTTFDYRRSGTGPTNGLLQYSLDGTNFSDVGAVLYPTSASTGDHVASLPSFSAITGLQNVAEGTTITLRLVNWGGTSTAGTFYLWDFSNSTANDFAISGTATPVTSAVPEPSTYAAIFGGIVLVGAVVQRRKKSQSVDGKAV